MSVTTLPSGREVADESVARTMNDMIAASGLQGYEFREIWIESTVQDNQAYVVVRTSPVPGDYLVTSQRCRVIFISAKQANPEPMQRDARLVMAYLKDTFKFGQIFGLSDYGSVSAIMPMEDGRFAVEFEVTARVGS